MTYADVLEEVASSSQDALADLLTRHKDGDLSEAAFIALAVAITTRVNARAVVFADVALAADLTARTGTAVPALGLGPDPADADRLEKSFRTILDDLDPGPVTQSEVDRIHKLARNEPLRSASEARGEGLKRSPKVEGWTRGLDADPCPLCIGLAGPVLPKTARMARHPGCSCVQIPTTN